jgi:hypothetical protein
MTTPTPSQPLETTQKQHESEAVLRILYDLRTKVREIDTKLEYLIEQNSEHFRCLVGYKIRKESNYQPF